jgi:hypothetical protein
VKHVYTVKDIFPYFKPLWAHYIASKFSKVLKESEKFSSKNL